MKQETLNTLMVVRMLFDKAHELCSIDDRFIASAGIVILQDALELVLYACSIELGIDEEKSIENFTFDQLLGELQKRGKKIIKSGTLKALNKERVLVKHYGQVAEPATVRNYLDAARGAIDKLLVDVIGKDLTGIMLNELIHKEETRNLIEAACKLIDEGLYYDALVEIRKAIFIEVEEEYSVEGWKEHPRGKNIGILGSAGMGGWKAPWYAKNREWIEENVRCPFDYIQYDHEKLRVDLMEWGITTQDFWNLWRLTPQVYRFKDSKKWIVKGEFQYILEGATEENAKYCLDRAVSLVLKKQEHFDLGRYLSQGDYTEIKIRSKKQQPIFTKAQKDSQVLGQLEEGKIYSAKAIVSGLDGESEFVIISHFELEPTLFLFGYAQSEFCEIVEPAQQE